MVFLGWALSRYVSAEVNTSSAQSGALIILIGLIGVWEFNVDARYVVLLFILLLSWIVQMFDYISRVKKLLRDIARIWVMSMYQSSGWDALELRRIKSEALNCIISIVETAPVEVTRGMEIH